MTGSFFEQPILNSPYQYPARHWELDHSGQPTSKIIDARRRVEFITPIPKPKKRKKAYEDSPLKLLRSVLHYNPRFGATIPSKHVIS